MDNITQWRNVKKIFASFVPTHIAVKVHHKANWNPPKRYHYTTVDVVKSDTLETALTLQQPLIHVLADDMCPGGCVEAGAGMQEESLFRRSALYKYFTTNLYPILNDEAIYAANVPLLYGCFASFVACPGIKLPHLTSDNMLKNDDVDILIKKIELILQIAYDNGHSSCVLGALGCGVWGCPSKHVASIIKGVLQKYDGCFETVLVAVLGANYNIFHDVFVV